MGEEVTRDTEAPDPELVGLKPGGWARYTILSASVYELFHKNVFQNEESWKYLEETGSPLPGSPLPSQR